MATKTKRKRKSKAKIQWRRYLLLLMGLLLLLWCAYLVYINYRVTHEFEQLTSAKPSRVYARPLLLKVGLKLKQSALIKELNLLAYRKNTLATPGSYQAFDYSVRIYRRAFEFPDSDIQAARFDVYFKQGFITGIFDEQGNEQDSLLLDPVRIASFYTHRFEDRQVLNFNEIPQPLIDILLTVEDREFYHHYGVNPWAIARALWVNIKANKTLQGGSTLTQQLVKNVFLTAQKSLWRKLNELFYALLLEFHYDKNTLLTAYVNQVFLLQQKSLAIHGFALASETLFRKQLKDLSWDQYALLVSMIKGPSYYNPIKHPQRAIKRRNLIIALTYKQGLMSSKQAKYYQSRPLGLQTKAVSFKRYPAFLDLVKKQLPHQYAKTDLQKAGLNIFTTLNPMVQQELEQAVIKHPLFKNNNKLQTGVVSVDYRTGHIQAMVGGRNPHYAGFNRAILAQRPIGSLIKPLLLYSLLVSGESLNTQVKDKPIKLRQSDGALWQPQNYDGKLHGTVSLYQALVHSYNLPFVNIGLQKGLKPLVALLERFHLQKNAVIYPSLLLGALELSPLEVTQLYQTLANKGAYIPLNSIRYVTNADNVILTRRSVQQLQLLDTVATEQVKSAMLGVMQKGTARSTQILFPNIALAGKTGTTDDYKDSWFVGYDGQLLTTVWMGSDKDQSIHLSGSSGALKLWQAFYQHIALRPVLLAQDDTLEWAYTDETGHYLMDKACANSQYLPFKAGEVPEQRKTCDGAIIESNWFLDLFR